MIDVGFVEEGRVGGASLKVKTDSATEPVDLATAKAYAKIESTDEDTVSAILLTQARQMIERKLNRAFVDKTFLLSLEEHPRIFNLPIVPAKSISSIVRSYQGEDNTLTADDDYFFRNYAELGTIEMSRRWAGYQLKIEFVAGYGSTGADVPAEFKTAILQTFKHNFDQRDLIAKGTIAVEIPYNAMKQIETSIAYLW